MHNDEFSSSLRPSHTGAGKPFTARPAAQPKTTGHDTVLRALKNKGSMTTIIFAGGDDTMTGVIVAHDKYTVTLLEGDIRHIVFKHDVRELYSKDEG